MKYRGRDCNARPFADASGAGTEYLQADAVVLREYATRTISPEEAADGIAETARVAKIETIVANARAVRQALKDATLTFGSAARDKAVLDLARAVLFLARGEVNDV